MRVVLGDVASIERSSVKAEEITDGSTYVGLEHIQPSGQITGFGSVAAGEIKSAKLKFSEEHVLFGKLRPNLGKVADPDFSGICSTDILPVRPGPRLDRRFLFHYLRLPSVREEATKLATGANLPRLKPQALAEFEIPLPSMEEQKRIAAILDAADNLRTKRRQALNKLDTLTQAIFHDMFGDPLANDLGWESAKLADICEGIFDCPHSTPKWADDGLICLRTSNLSKGRWQWEDTRFVSDETFAERSRRAEILAGDIVLSREGTIGVAAIVEEGMRVCMGQRLVQVRSDSEYVLPSFLLEILLYLLAPNRISSVLVGSTAKHLNVKELRQLKIVLPPIERQTEFEKVAGRVRAGREALIAHSGALDLFFSSVQQRAFRGEL